MSARHAEAVAYAVAVVVLVVGGAVFRTPILNWISGPAIVIAVVALLPAWLSRGGDQDEGRGEKDDPDS